MPYGALLSADIANLAAGGRGIGVEPRAVSAVRLIPVCIATGQAAGIAAALAVLHQLYGLLEVSLNLVVNGTDGRTLCVTADFPRN